MGERGCSPEMPRRGPERRSEYWFLVRKVDEINVDKIGLLFRPFLPEQKEPRSRPSFARRTIERLTIPIILYFFLSKNFVYM